METYFNDLGSKIDDQWLDVFDQVLNNSQSTDSLSTRSRLTALGSTFTAFTAGLGEESLQGGGSLETILTSAATSQEVRSLVVSNDQFATATRSFPQGTRTRTERRPGRP